MIGWISTEPVVEPDQLMRRVGEVAVAINADLQILLAMLNCVD